MAQRQGAGAAEAGESLLITPGCSSAQTSGALDRARVEPGRPSSASFHHSHHSLHWFWPTIWAAKVICRGFWGWGRVWWGAGCISRVGIQNENTLNVDIDPKWVFCFFFFKDKCQIKVLLTAEVPGNAQSSLLWTKKTLDKWTPWGLFAQGTS